MSLQPQRLQLVEGLTDLSFLEGYIQGCNNSNRHLRKGYKSFEDTGFNMYISSLYR